MPLLSLTFAVIVVFSAGLIIVVNSLPSNTIVLIPSQLAIQIV
jgi:hypothetical protein